MPKPSIEWTITLPDHISVRQALAVMATFNLLAEHDPEDGTLVFRPRNGITRCPTRAEVNRAMVQTPPEGLGLRVMR